MAQWKLAKIAPNRCFGVDCKASVSPWCAGQQWNHLKYILEVVPPCGVRAGSLVVGYRRRRPMRQAPKVYTLVDSAALLHTTATR